MKYTDIDDVNVVINYDFPLEIETYVHRIGRTGRKNNKGFSYSFFTDMENSKLAQSLINILDESKNPVPEALKQIALSRKTSSKSLKMQNYNRNFDSNYRQNSNKNYRNYNNSYNNNYNNNYKNYNNNYNNRNSQRGRRFTHFDDDDY